jgi:hypothetical protein
MTRWKFLVGASLLGVEPAAIKPEWDAKLPPFGFMFQPFTSHDFSDKRS